MGKLLPYILFILLALSLSACTIGIFDFDDSTEDASESECETTLVLRDESGVSLEGTKVARGSEISILANGTGPYTGGVSDGNLSIKASSTEAAKFNALDLPSGEVVVTLSLRDAARGCGTTSFIIPAGGAADDSFGTEGTLVSDPSAGGDDELGSVEYDSYYDRILALGTVDGGAVYSTLLKVLDNTGNQTIASTIFAFSSNGTLDESVRSLVIDPLNPDRYYVSGSIYNGSFTGYADRLVCNNCDNASITIVQDTFFAPLVSGILGSLDGGISKALFNNGEIFFNLGAPSSVGQIVVDDSGVQSLTFAGGAAPINLGTRTHSIAMDADGNLLSIFTDFFGTLYFDSIAYATGSATALWTSSLTSIDPSLTSLLIRDIRVLPNGRVLAVGDNESDLLFIGLFEDPTLAGIEAGDLLDHHVGTTGVLDLSSTFESVRDIEVDSEGSVFVGGSYMDANLKKKGFVAKFRVTDAGSLELDTGFGAANGIQVIDFGTDHSVVRSLSRDFEGRLLVGGDAWMGTDPRDWAIQRIYP